MISPSASASCSSPPGTSVGSSTRTTGHDQKSTRPRGQSPPESPEPPPQIPTRPTWPLIAGGIAIFLIGFVAIKGIVACTDPERECVTLHLQHAFAILGTVTAALATVTQGKTAKRKSDYHEYWKTKGNDETLKGAHAYDANHFNMVSFWWYTFFVGALAAVVAEFIDWWGKPLIDWLSRLF